jgi:hypothetical protein
MRGTVAKRIRKRVYGDMSLRLQREYGWKRLDPLHKGGYHDKEGNKFSALVVIGKRQEYQKAKRDYVHS